MQFRNTLPLFALWLTAASAATLDGTVLDSATARPLARCQAGLVALQNGYELPLKTTLTDSGGRFRFEGLPAGTYFVTVRRSGYQTARYGQKRWDGAGAPIILPANGEFSTEFRLKRLGAVAGTVLDENGVGLPGNTVTAYQFGARPLRPAGSAVSDDRGVYRIAGLAPGTYYIRTGPQKLEDGRSLLPTFFGQVSGAATPVSADLDREAGAIDIQPQGGELGYLRGRITGAPMSRVWLFSEMGTRQATPGGSGEFTFDQLAPGDYELLAQSGAGSLVAYRKIRIQTGANDMAAAAGALPIVRIRIEESGAKPLNPLGVTVSLERKGFSEPLPFPQPLPMLTGGGVLQVMPGDYVASAQTSQEYYVRSIRNTVEALPGGAAEVAVAVSSRPASLSGKITAGGQVVAGAPVFLNALDPELRARLAGVRAARADGAGVYKFMGLPPGDYEAFSSFELQSPQQDDFKRVPVKVVNIQEGGHATLDLDLFGSL